jgi:tetratricopeptide (TPR) repeat protein
MSEPQRPDGRRLFIGRERELAELQAGVADAVGGRGRLFLLVGEAGIGKTRLATEVQTTACAAGAQVRWARCWEGGGAPAFWPWSMLLRALARECPDSTVAAALAAGPAATQLAPELRLRAPNLPPPAEGSGLDSEHARFPLFEAVASVLRHLADAHPLVLVLDDLHAADHASLLLLAFLARDLHDARVLLIGTYRDIEAQQDGERARLLTGIGRAGHRLPLGGWGEDEVTRYVAGACGTTPAAELIRALHRVTEGNPFFVDEIVRLLIAEGGGRLPARFALRIPRSIGATIRERLRPFPPPLQRALAAAAVIGRDFDLATVREACASDTDSLLDGLGQAEAAGVVQRLPGVLGRYSFTHALIRETVYSDLAPTERAGWHLCVGEALERLHTADLEPHLDALAHHFALAAGQAGDIGKAIVYSVRAARHAANLLAFEEATRHYECALQVQALQVPLDQATQLMLRLGLGEMQAAAWNLPAARATLLSAADLARRLEQPDAFARAALGFAGLGFGLPRGVVDADIVALLEESLQQLGERRDAIWARAAVRLAVELHFSAEAERRDALSRYAVDTARRLDDPATLAYVINARHFAVWSTAEHDERLALADEAIRLAERVRDPDLLLQARTWRLLDLAEIGDSIGFDRELESYERLSEQRRLPKYLALVLALHGLRALWMGQFDAAIGHAEAALALGERVGDRASFMSVSVQIFFARRAQGRLAELEPIARALAEQYTTIPATRCALALLYAELGRTEEARREYERLAADDFVSLQNRNILHPLLPLLGELCVVLDDRRRAPILYRQLLPFAGRVMGLGPNVLIGPASHTLGTLAGVLEQWDRAEQHFESALEETARMQAPVWRAHVEYDYARCLVACGALERADELAAAAAARARGLGMPPLLARAGALRARCADATPEDTQRAAVGARDSAAPSPALASGKDSGARVLRFPVKGAGRVAATRSGNAHDCLLRCEGEYWTVGYDGDVLRLRSTSGLRYLAHLLRHPGREFHALDLAALERAPDATAPSPLAAEQAAELGLPVAQGSAGEELLDPRARAAYKEQLDDLRDQLEEAQRFNDHARATRVQGEIDFLARELARAVGLHGHARPGASRAERARLNVTRAIKSAMRRIDENHHELGLYLTTTIKTGLYCSYTPDPRLTVHWVF